MRTLVIALTALSALASFSAAPSQAASTFKPWQHRGPYYCVPPKHLDTICVAWAPGAPGTFAGPCIKYQTVCAGDPPPIH
jgi:hypothetical protein